MLTLDNGIDPATYVIEKLAKFIEVYGPTSFDGDVERLQNELDWFASIGRLWTITYLQMLLGVGTGLRLDSPNELEKDNWYQQESDTGKYFYVHNFVIHPDYKNYGISKAMIELIESHLKGIRYLMWDGRSGKFYIKKISSIIGKRRTQNV